MNVETRIKFFTPFDFLNRYLNPIDTIVLDLDNTLIYSRSPSEKPKGISSPKRIRYFSTLGYDVAMRPGLIPFLNFIKKRFSKIIVWSAGTRKYVNCIVDNIFEKVGYRPDAILAREDCVQLKENQVYTKPLYKIVEMGHAKSLDNVVLLDDLATNFAPNPSNGIHIPSFEGDEDNSLIKLMDWFNSRQNITIEDLKEFKF